VVLQEETPVGLSAGNCEEISMDEATEDFYATLRDSLHSPSAEASSKMSNWWLVAAELVDIYPQLRLEGANSTQVEIGTVTTKEPSPEKEVNVPQTALRLRERETGRTFAWLGPTDHGYFLARDCSWQHVALSGVLEGGPETLARIHSRSWQEFLDGSQTRVTNEPLTTYAATVYDLAMTLSCNTGMGEGVTASPIEDAAADIWSVNVPNSLRELDPRSMCHREKVLVELLTGVWRDANGVALDLLMPWRRNLR
jgi:hypothetical protein